MTVEYNTIPRHGIYLFSERVLNPDYTPVNLTGYTATLHIVTAYGATPVVSLDETFGIDLGTDGMAVASIDTDELPDSHYAFDWVVRDTAGVAIVERSGIFFLGATV